MQKYNKTFNVLWQVKSRYITLLGENIFAHFLSLKVNIAKKKQKKTKQQKTKNKIKQKKNTQKPPKQTIHYFPFMELEYLVNAIERFYKLVKTPNMS